MAFYDWNKDGKKDVQDDFIEYNIYKSSTGNNNNYTGGLSGGESGCGFWFLFVIIMIIIGIFNR